MCKEKAQNNTKLDKSVRKKQRTEVINLEYMGACLEPESMGKVLRVCAYITILRKESIAFIRFQRVCNPN